MRHTVLLLVLAFSGVSGGGCSSFSMPKPKAPKMPHLSLPKVNLPFVGRKAVGVPGVSPTIEKPNWSPYPRRAKYGDNLDILVVQHRHSLTLVNREPRSFAGMQLWLNQQYVAAVEQAPIGPGPSIDLISFTNQHGESYPEPAFLKPEKGYPIVSAEFFDPTTGLRHKLLAKGR